jgi:four helix bundle protein
LRFDGCGGTVRADLRYMASVKRLQELNTWRFANELKIQVYAILARPRVRSDFKFCDQIRESTRSATRNIAEGFGRRRRPREFARFLMIALGSLEETKDHLQDGLKARYIDRSEFDSLTKLASRSIGAGVRLMQCLDTCPERKPPNLKPSNLKPSNLKPSNLKPPNPKPPNPQPSTRSPASKKESNAAQEEAE